MWKCLKTHFKNACCSAASAVFCYRPVYACMEWAYASLTTCCTKKILTYAQHHDDHDVQIGVPVVGQDGGEGV
jgi:hypothetical protein